MIPPTSCSAQSRNQKQQRSLVNALAIGIIKLQAAVCRSLQGCKKHNNIHIYISLPHTSVAREGPAQTYPVQCPVPYWRAAIPAWSITKRGPRYGRFPKHLQGVNTALLPADPGAGIPDLWGEAQHSDQGSSALCPPSPSSVSSGSAPKDLTPLGSPNKDLSMAPRLSWALGSDLSCSGLCHEPLLLCGTQNGHPTSHRRGMWWAKGLSWFSEW